jgi:hypothetical protein
VSGAAGVSAAGASVVVVVSSLDENEGVVSAVVDESVNDEPADEDPDEAELLELLLKLDELPEPKELDEELSAETANGSTPDPAAAASVVIGAAGVVACVVFREADAPWTVAPPEVATCSAGSATTTSNAAATSARKGPNCRRYFSTVRLFSYRPGHLGRLLLHPPGWRLHCLNGSMGTFGICPNV